jgi:hypothetical protein
VRENRRLGRTIDTCSLAPSNCASCIFAIARSASSISSYMMYAVPRLTLNVGFMGMRRSLMTPYLPKISRMWSSLTFLVSASTTICDVSASSMESSTSCLTFALLGAGDPSFGVGLRV